MYEIGWRVVENHYLNRLRQGPLEHALEILPARLGQRLQVDPRLQAPRTDGMSAAR